MAPLSPTAPVFVSMYHEFRVPLYRSYKVEGERELSDKDGAVLYETDYGQLFLAIIKHNDVARLEQYLAKRSVGKLPMGSILDDPFLNAAAYGSIDVLRVLIDRFPDQREELYKHGHKLLYTACVYAQVEIVQFLLDSQPPFGDIHAKNANGMTALLGAASSLEKSTYVINSRQAPGADQVTKSEELIQFLLDRGASACDTVPAILRHEDASSTSQPVDTVLGLAISKAHSTLLNRLIDEGVNAHEKTIHKPYVGILTKINGHKFGKWDIIWDVTALHIGSFYWNTEGVQTLFDRRGSVEIADMVCCRDSAKHLPLHWAAWGPPPFPDGDGMSFGDGAVVEAVNTMRLLLVPDPSTINSQDNDGNTPLHYAVKGHAGHGSKFTEIAR